MTIDFTKNHESRLLLAQKTVSAAGLTNQKAQVIAVIDISLSMMGSFLSGRIQKTLDRILPLAMQFDDDGNIDIYLFHWFGFHNRKPFTLNNRKGYVLKQIVLKHALNSILLGFATFYSPLIKRISKTYSQAGKNNTAPVFVLYFTDGDAWDKKSTEKSLLKTSQQGIFWKFIGLGGKEKNFAFLQKLDDLEGRKVDNADFLHLKNPNAVDDEELYKLLLREFNNWLKQARQEGIID